METILTIQEKQRVEDLFSRIANLIETSRARVVTAVNVAEVYTKYEIGRYIIEDEQGGSIRAQYGKKVLKELSQKLTRRFGDGWSVDTLEKCRKFYHIYMISATPSRKLATDTSFDPASWVDFPPSRLLLHECWQLNAGDPRHTSAEALAEGVPRERFGRVLLVHLNPSWDAAEREEVERVAARHGIELARDGMVMAL